MWETIRGRLGWRFASKKIFKAKIFLRHYKVIALALGAPGVGRPARGARAGSGAGSARPPGSPGPAGRPGADRGPRDARTVRHYKVIVRTL